MGWILSKFRRKRSTYEELEKIEAQLNSLGKLKTETLVWQKKVLGHLVTYSILIYLIAALVVYFRFLPWARDRKDQAILLLPFLITPLLIYVLRRILTWWYHRKVARGDSKLAALREKKAKILEEVMEKETYKVAKLILDKFGPGKNQTLATPPRPTGPARPGAPGGGASGMELRRRPQAAITATTGGTATPSIQAGHAPASVVPRSGVGGSGGPTPGLGRGVGPALPGAPPGGPPSMLTHSGGRGGAPGPPLPRPVLPRERGYLDTFVEYLVGDGPANRYALICRQCQSHNGMALREEFEYIAYRCCYCYYWNPARKQRPVAPRLPDPSVQPMTRESSSSEESDRSTPSSSAPSRRASIDNEIPEVEKDKPLLDTEPLENDTNAETLEKEVVEEEAVATKSEENKKVEDEEKITNSQLPDDETNVLTVKDCADDDWGLVINQHEVKEETIADEEAMEVEEGKVETKCNEIETDDKSEIKDTDVAI